MVKNLAVMQETQIRSLGWEDPMEKGKATYSSILDWRIAGTDCIVRVTEPGTTERLSLHLPILNRSIFFTFASVTCEKLLLS